jgi:CheY-like chemotaxis protein
LHEQMVEAERLSTAQQMAGAVSHEFSQPLQALKLMAEGILGECQPSQAVGLSQVIDRINTLVKKVQHLSRVETKPYGRTRIIDLERSSPEQKSDSRKILVVDDEELIRELLQTVVQQYEFSVDVAAEGKEALERLSSESYGLVLCDVAMPGMNGIELFLQASERYPDVPFVMMSGYTVNDDEHRTIRQASGFLQKPFGVDKVREVLIKIFGDLPEAKRPKRRAAKA